MIPSSIYVLLVLQYLIGESWHLFSTDTKIHCSPFLWSDHYDSPAWIVKELSEHINRLIIAIILVILANKYKNEGLFVIFVAYMLYRAFDILAFFIDHNNWAYYPAIYTGITFFEVIGLTIYFIKDKK